MHYAGVTDAEVKQAQVPHNLFISGLFLFDLLMIPAIIVLNIGMVGLLIPLLCSSGLILYIYLRSKKTSSWFIDAHWKLAYARGRWLLMAYAISAGLIFIAWLISLSAHNIHTEHILWIALTRIALMPTLVLVMVTAVQEASAISLATKREVPDRLAATFPPPVL